MNSFLDSLAPWKPPVPSRKVFGACALGLVLLMAGPPAEAGRAGRLKVLGGAKKVHRKYRGRRTRFYEVSPGRTLRLRLEGPMSLGLLFSSDSSAPVRLSLTIDKAWTASPTLYAGHRGKRIVVSIDPGRHVFTISSQSRVFVKPRRLRRGPKPSDQVVTLAKPLEAVAVSGNTASNPRVQPAARPARLPAARVATPPAARPLVSAGDPKEGKNPSTADGTRSAGATSEHAGADSSEPIGVSASSEARDGAKEKAGRRTERESVSLSRKVQAVGKGIGLQIALSGGAGYADQDWSSASPAFELHAQASYEILRGLRVWLSYDSRFHRQTYHSVDPDPSSLAPKSVEVHEQFWDTALGVGFDVLNNQWYQTLPMLGLEVSLAPKFFILANDVFGSWAGGFRLGALFSLRGARGLVFKSWAGWVMPAFGDRDPEILSGALSQFVDYGLAVEWRFAGRRPFHSWGLELAFNGDSIFFERNERTYLGASAGFSLDF